MPLIMNGVTIPTNVANVLTYNGTNITKVIFNNTEVWAQSLFNAQWSGNSQSSGYSRYIGLGTSNNLFRCYTTSGTGPWITTTLSGTFVGNSIINNPYHANTGFITSGNLLRFSQASNWCTFNIGSGWTGSSGNEHFWYNFGYTDSVHRLNTSGGLIRVSSVKYTGADFGHGAWVSLT